VDLLPEDGSGTTPLPHALDLARELLNDRAESSDLTNPRKTILVISDGEPAYLDDRRKTLTDPTGDEVTDGDGNPFVSDTFDGLVDDDGQTDANDETLLVARDIDTGPQTDSDTDATDGDDISGENGITIRTVGLAGNEDPLNDFLSSLATRSGLFYNTSLSQDLVELTGEIIDDLNVVTGEEVFFRGTLAELAGEMPIPLDGKPMGSDFLETDWQADKFGEGSADPQDADSRHPFDASSTQCFGLAWWVPEDVGNEIQGDSVSFDLGFYAEQARNNDSPGQTLGGS
jgi:hypothetical protein